MKALKTLVATAMLAAASMAKAEFFTGNDLLMELDRPRDSSGHRLAMGYIAGVFDSKQGVDHCPPANVTLGQVRDVVHQWLIQVPKHRHHTGDVLVGIVLSVTWPCPTEQKRQKGNGNT